MKPIFQNIFSSGEDSRRGNCYAACIASVLELELYQVPHLMGEEDWLGKTNLWLSSRGMGMIMLKLETEEAYIHPLPPGMMVILGGNTTRHPTRLHAVVGVTKLSGVPWDFVHDPHPDNSFLTKVTDLSIITYLNPSTSIWSING